MDDDDWKSVQRTIQVNQPGKRMTRNSGNTFHNSFITKNVPSFSLYKSDEDIVDMNSSTSVSDDISRKRTRYSAPLPLPSISYRPKFEFRSKNRDSGEK